ncbi:DUF4412 domain-containing protein [Tenacibaculum sp. 190524A05c]|uniref:DUF4412 domain-containing protein n=1 Tax=Tenacibaculum platacis TaxID=3137852 RepID=UPI0031FAE505
MKIKFLSFILLLVVNSIVAQKSFEGVITYKLSYQDKTGEMSDEEAKEFMGSKQTYYIKGNKFKTEMNGMLKMSQYYTGKDSIYTKMGTSQFLMYIKTDEQKEKILSIEEKKSVTKIMGKDCDLLDIKTDEGTIQYYFTSDFKVNAEDYKNYKYGLWYYCLDKANGSLPVKLIMDTEELKLTIEAVKVENKELDDAIFELPKGMNIIKMPEE